MRGPYRDSTPARIEAAQQRLADLRRQHAAAETRYEDARAALHKLTAKAPPPRRGSSFRPFSRGALLGVVISLTFFLLEALGR